ncbi:uncharacterized protein SCODWIG_00689 [Saccharomycodes ludwigii]|uniref:Uncharacterized protein n=2 Tax=Saccharomycodes ludwigii TaxID=36035 RepID=A0A376B2M3_9ASCO|nr:uncharacterized protein SCODWIG_00689 [Saccharomycodes ludwigii]
MGKNQETGEPVQLATDESASIILPENRCMFQQENRFLIKYSLFHMLYSYLLIQEVLKHKVYDDKVAYYNRKLINDDEWINGSDSIELSEEEIKKITRELRKAYNNNNKKKRKKKNDKDKERNNYTDGMDTFKHFFFNDNELLEFYRTWRREFLTDLDAHNNIDRLMYFNIPNFSFYPPNFKKVCEKLHKFEFNSIDEFADLYQSTNDKIIRKLLGNWFVDHSNLFSNSNFEKYGNEKFYRAMLGDCGRGSKGTFKRYFYLLDNDANIKQKFCRFILLNGNNTISFETYLLLFKTAINNNVENDIIIRLLSLARKNSILDEDNNLLIRLEDGRKDDLGASNINEEVAEGKRDIDNKATVNIKAVNNNDTKKTIFQMISENEDFIDILQMLSSSKN